ncbi:hypothetical protein NWP96_06815 [Mycoplasmopsis cynos]|nr:hypothetical protein [Mycoplasmopsis cynos]
MKLLKNKFLTIPTSDNDKIGFFELINLLTNKSNSLNKKDINSKNEILKNSSNEVFLSIENFINFLDKQTVDVDLILKMSLWISTNRFSLLWLKY